ncbi:MAG: IS1380 family transposase [Prevotella sp.]|nr:IS1380 family transposase [Prevotella sp.]
MAAKVQIKNEKYMPYGGIYFVIREFLLKMAPIIDGYLGLRSMLVGYQYSEISLAMLCNFMCGGDRTEDIYRVHDMIEQKPGLRICSPDTVLRAMTELSVDDVTYTSEAGKQYRFNTAERLNGLLVYAAVKSGMLRPGEQYDFDFDHEFLASETWDALPTYKGHDGYSPACAVLTSLSENLDVIAGIENRDGNATVKFHQEDTLMRILLNIIEQGIRIRHARVDCGSYSKEVVRLLLEHSERIFVRAGMTKTLREKLRSANIQWRKVEMNFQQTEVTTLPFDGLDGEIKGCRLVFQRQHKGTGAQLDCFEEGGDDVYVYRAILTNEWDMSEEQVIHFYNQRGAKEKVFDQMDNDFGWHYLPKGLLRENTVFLLLTAMLRNFYRLLLMNDALRAFGIWCTTRMKTFTARVVTVVARWTRGGRRDILTLYTSNSAYAALYADYG